MHITTFGCLYLKNVEHQIAKMKAMAMERKKTTIIQKFISLESQGFAVSAL